MGAYIQKMTTEKETLKKVREIIEELKREDEECRSVIYIDYYDLINEIKELEGKLAKEQSSGEAAK